MLYTFQLLQEEMTSQQPHYEQFIQCGLAILEKCDHESSEAQSINQQLDNINQSWDKLAKKLGQREAALKDTLDLSRQYYDVLQGLTDWTAEFGDKIDHLPPVGNQAEEIEQQKEKLKVPLPSTIV